MTTVPQTKPPEGSAEMCGEDDAKTSTAHAVAKTVQVMAIAAACAAVAISVTQCASKVPSVNELQAECIRGRGAWGPSGGWLSGETCTFQKEAK